MRIFLVYTSNSLEVDFQRNVQNIWHHNALYKGLSSTHWHTNGSFGSSEALRVLKSRI